MKIYATTTSERASKGQGGNKYIDIKITDDKKMPIYQLAILPDDEGWLFIENGTARTLKRHGGGYEVNIQDAIVRLLEAKCEKKKCHHYDYLPYKESDLNNECRYCIENRKQTETKGNKKKGECKHFIVRDAYGKEYCQECGTYNEMS